MTCEQCDLVGALEGWDPESAAHVARCSRCARELERLRALVETLDVAWQEGRLEDVMREAGGGGPARLPPRVADLVEKLRQAAVAADLRDRLGMDAAEAKRLVERARRSREREMPLAASPDRLLRVDEDEATRRRGEDDDEDP